LETNEKLNERNEKNKKERMKRRERREKFGGTIGKKGRNVKSSGGRRAEHREIVDIINQ